MTDFNGVNEAFNSGYTIKLVNRGPKSSGITFELKTVFDEMAKKGLIKDIDGKGLTKQDAMNMYRKLNEIHEAGKKSTNYTRMRVGQEFNYTADEFSALAKAAGYEVVKAEPEPEADPAPIKLNADIGSSEINFRADVPEPGVVLGSAAGSKPAAPVTTNPKVDDDKAPVSQPTVEKADPAPEAKKPQKLTREQVEEFAAKDERVATLEAQLGDLKRQADELAAKPMGGLNGVSPLDVGKARDTYRFAQRAINMYKNILAGWQDGQKGAEINGVPSETTTLPNGQKGFKIETTENGQDVVYYANISFHPEEGQAEAIPGDIVEVWVDGKKVEQPADK